jgi:hypothetical protein
MKAKRAVWIESTQIRWFSGKSGREADYVSVAKGTQN